MPDKNDGLYAELETLLEEYDDFISSQNPELVTEQTIRAWLDRFLRTFGWDPGDTREILQESVVDSSSRERLAEIGSHHIRPDYTLVNGPNVKTYLDAKSLDVDCFSDSHAAFQVKSYGWSAGVPYAFVSNFDQLAIYDCGPVPSEEDAANTGAVLKINRFQYLDQLETIRQYLEKAKVYSGSLDILHESLDKSGSYVLDEQFNDYLESFRLSLSQSIVLYKTTVTNSELNFLVQTIMNRILFIRVCEAKGVEKEGLLKDFLKNGFWQSFKQYCKTSFYQHYDGALFSKLNSLDTVFIPDNDPVFEDFILKLYYPYPYKFDAIPVAALAKIYESFLSKSVVHSGTKVEVVLKPEYVKTKGAIPTPGFIAKEIANLALDINQICSIDELLSLRILDPCCGSGVFLIQAMDLLEKRMKEIFTSSPGERTKNSELFVSIDGDYRITVQGKLAISTNCLYGIDIDPVAIEITKMSLSLKVVDSMGHDFLKEEGLFGKKILHGIADNLRIGNALIDPNDAVPELQYVSIRPLDVLHEFSGVFLEKGGFDHIIGNPPYVETKFFKKENKTVHEILSRKYSSFEGKADLAVLFIERCLEWLNPQGALGFIVQRRWFKTDYGKGIRKIIGTKKCVKKIINFENNGLFPGLITYVAALILSGSPSEEVAFSDCSLNRIELRSFVENNLSHEYKMLDESFFGVDPWNPESAETVPPQLKKRLLEEHGSLGDKRYLAVKDGIQVLWKKAYHLRNYRFSGDHIIGVNGLGETVEIEKECCRPIIYNRQFYPLKRIVPDAYAIFPYDPSNNKTKLSMTELSARYPLCHKYLSDHESLIKANVTCPSGDLWPTFTREHNQEMFDVKKVIIPMTATSVTGTFFDEYGVYMDNANVWFISDSGDRADILKLVALIVNSLVYNSLAKCGANPAAGGFYKFNKQFLCPVPFPDVESLDQAKKDEGVALFGMAIFANQLWETESGYSNGAALEGLKTIWHRIDEYVAGLYGLSAEEFQLLASAYDDNRFKAREGEANED